MLNQLNTTTKRELDVRYQSNTEEIQEIEDKLQTSKQITNTSGTLTISDYGLTESIELYFKPSQDLHGYDKPWAGGTGKNKLIYPYDATSKTESGITFTVNTDGTIEADGTASADITIGLGKTYISNNDFTFSGISTGSVNTYYLRFIARDSGGQAVQIDGQVFIDVYTQETTKTLPDTVSYVDSYVGVKKNTVLSDILFEPMIRLSKDTDSTFEPYANICPIIGQDKASLTWNSNQGIAMNFGTTYYGGIANFEGDLSIDWQRIASYDGESITGEWLSDRDEYASGTTPSTGAEVVYKTTPTTVKVTKPANLNLTDDYPISYNGYKLDVTYQPKDTILEEAKSYTNQEIEKLGLPQAPTSNGTYNLVCTVASGVPTLSWESNT